MTSFTESAARPRPARKDIALFNLIRIPVFVVIQTWAAISLDGWLAVALWINAAYNAALLVATVTVLTLIAVEATNKARGA